MVVATAHMIQLFPNSFSHSTYKLAALIAGGAVMAFFAISGFFIHKSVASNSKYLHININHYFIKRINRIIPPFIFSIILTIMLWATAPYVFESNNTNFITSNGRDNFSLEGLIPTIFFLNNFIGPTLNANGALWSLTFEIWYYILAPLIFLWITKGIRKFLLLFLGISITLTTLSPSFALYGIVWTAGFCISIAHSNNIQLDKSGKLFFTTLLISLIFLIINFFSNEQQKLLILLFELSAGVAINLYFHRFLKKQHTAGINVLLTKPANFSYSLYITHFPIMLFAYGINTDQPYAALIIAIIIAYISGRYIEKLQIIKSKKFN